MIWLDDVLTTKVRVGVVTLNPTASVADMVDDMGQWKWHLYEHLLSVEVLLRIAAIKESFGVQFGPIEPVWKVIVGFKGIPCIKLFLWLLCHEKLLMNVKRSCRHLNLDYGCALCGVKHKDTDHILHSQRCTLGSLVRCLGVELVDSSKRAGV
ncbi:hypothetical protein V6N11_051893 [Hibiscus sabdariffa]|uniref:Reverse transcriptase zinc-binding domain-containing protein n=1 Tax=Hibiscus sabdariffa TaxID=183260 RepID=A0ABR2U8C9_9ROSI